MFERMMRSYGDDVNAIRGNWMNTSIDPSNKNLGVINTLTGQGAPLAQAVKETWTAQIAGKYGYTVPVIQADRVIGVPGNYTKVETLFYKAK
ncbi:hypothetical protein D3C85_1724560 [compost metagenome]